MRCSGLTGSQDFCKFLLNSAFYDRKIWCIYWAGAKKSAFRIHLILTWIRIRILGSTFGKSGTGSGSSDPPFRNSGSGSGYLDPHSEKVDPDPINILKKWIRIRVPIFRLRFFSPHSWNKQLTILWFIILCILYSKQLEKWYGYLRQVCRFGRIQINAFSGYGSGLDSEWGSKWIRIQQNIVDPDPQRCFLPYDVPLFSSSVIRHSTLETLLSLMHVMHACLKGTVHSI